MLAIVQSHETFKGQWKNYKESTLMLAIVQSQQTFKMNTDNIQKPKEEGEKKLKTESLKNLQLSVRVKLPARAN